MRFRNYRIPALVFVAAMLASVAPSTAGPFTARPVSVRRLAVLEGQLNGGGSALGFLLRKDYAQAEGQFRLLPLPTGGASQTLVPPPGTDIDTMYKSSSYYGCIVVKTSKGTDAGCSLLSGSNLSIEPLMDRATVTFSVRSVAYEGRQITMNAILTGFGDIYADARAEVAVDKTYARPRMTLIVGEQRCRIEGVNADLPCFSPSEAHNVQPAPEKPKSEVLTAWGDLVRLSTIFGTARSDTVGGSTFKASKSASVMVQGVGDSRYSPGAGMPVGTPILSIDSRDTVCVLNPLSPSDPPTCM